MAPEAVNGVLLVDKPSGVTSFDVVNAVRKSLMGAFPHLVKKEKGSTGHRPARFKCGHAGTLDPLATGLLVVLVGKASRLSHYLLGLDKSYHATIALGAATDTLDADGEVVATAPVPTDSQVFAAALPKFCGEIKQVPPVYSALKRDGRALYKMARAGENPAEPAARGVTIRRLDLLQSRLDSDTPEIDILVECSSGTYIRSLARDIAQAAGTLGHICQLRRLSVGLFEVGDSVTEVMGLAGHEILAQMLPMSAALPHLPTLTLQPDEVAAIHTGQQPQKSWLSRLDFAPVTAQKHGALFRLLDENAILVGVGCLDELTGDPRLAMVIPQ